MQFENKLFVSVMNFKKRHPRFILLTLIFVIVPVTSSFILGFEMKKEVALAIPTAVYNADNSEFSNEFIQMVSDSQAFNVVEVVDSYEGVNESIRMGRTMAGVIVPKDFYKNLLNSDAPKIVSVFDGSNLAVLTTSKTYMSDILFSLKLDYVERVYEKEQEVKSSMVEKKVSPIDFATRILYNPAKNFKNFLLPGMLIAIAQVAITMNGAEIGFESRMENLNFIRRIFDIAKWALVGSLSIFTALSVQWIFFGIPLRGTIIGMILLTYLYSVVMTSFGYVFGIIIPDRAFASQLSCVFVLPTSIIGGYTWPLLAMPKFMQVFARFFPFTYYGNEVRSLCLKPLELKHLIFNFQGLTIYFVVLLALIFIFTKIREKGNAERKLAG